MPATRTVKIDPLHKVVHKLDTSFPNCMFRTRRVEVTLAESRVKMKSMLE